MVFARSTARRNGAGGCFAALRGAVIAGAALVTAMSVPVAAQLGPGDLQRAHALTANSAGWVALRGAMQHVVSAAGIDTGDNVEEIADTLSVLLALEDGDGRLDAVIIGAVRGALTANAARDPDVDSVYARQGLTLARAKAISCLIVGQSPEERGGIAEALGLGPGEIANCPQAYAGFRDHWLEIAAPLRAANAGAGQPAAVELAPAGGAMASARAVLIAGQTLHEVANFFSTAIASPQAISIRALDCDTTAESPGPTEVRVCYRLVGELATGIERGIVAER